MATLRSDHVHAEPDGDELSAIATNGDLDVPDGALVRESLHADGHVHIGVGAIVKGSATAGGGADVGDGARIGGALHVEGPLAWGDAARAERALVRGPLVTSDGITRALRLTAEAGIHAEPTPEAVE